jgi:hypothetical protein
MFDFRISRAVISTLLLVACDGGAGGDHDGGVTIPIDAGRRRDSGPPPRACETHSQCRGGELCEMGECRQACAPDDPCTAAGTICDETRGVCVPGCGGDEDCGGGERCDDGRCVSIGPECTEDDQCAGGERCREMRCVPIGGDASVGDDGGTIAPMDGGTIGPEDGGTIRPRDGGPPPPSDAGARSCEDGCPATQRCCGDVCVNREVPVGDDGRGDGSFDNCNGCGIACNPDRASACSRSGGPPRCMCGTSTPCAGSDVCVPSEGSFACTDLDTDPDNCGSVGNVCAEGEVCSEGSCRCGDAGACPDGDSCCAGVCTDVTEDEEHCGGCFLACAPYGNRCVGGDCLCGTDSCERPSVATFGEVCCAGTGCVPQSDTNCGGCGIECAEDTMCISSPFLPELTCCAPAGFPICGF